jgi:hypothetical protein
LENDEDEIVRAYSTHEKEERECNDLVGMPEYYEYV